MPYNFLMIRIISLFLHVCLINGWSHLVSGLQNHWLKLLLIINHRLHIGLYSLIHISIVQIWIDFDQPSTSLSMSKSDFIFILLLLLLLTLDFPIFVSYFLVCALIH